MERVIAANKNWARQYDKLLAECEAYRIALHEIARWDEWATGDAGADAGMMSYTALDALTRGCKKGPRRKVAYLKSQAPAPAKEEE